MSEREQAADATLTLGRILAVRAQAHPHRAALTGAAERLDYAALNGRANRLANGLLRAGVAPGDRVATVLPNCGAHISLLFACARIGAIAAPLDRRLAEAELSEVLADAEPRLVLRSEEEVASLVSADDSAPATAVDPRAPLLLAYTSGTTGRPKGVLLSHLNMVWAALNQIVDWSVSASDVALAAAPLFHMGGLLALSLPTLHAGGTLHVAPSTDPEDVAAAIERERVSCVFLPPPAWRALARSPALRRADLRSLRLGATGGDPLPAEVVAQLLAALDADFVEAYGLSEASSCVTQLRRGDLLRKRGSVGTPFAHVALRVVDEDGRDSGAGAVGEILVAGPTVMAGYWRHPEETAAALRDGWLHTGDLGRLDGEGFLEVVARKGDGLVVEGGKLYPAEVERVLQTCPGVTEAAVFAVDRDGGSVLAAAVAGAFDDGALVEHCRSRLATYKLPRFVVTVGALPRSPSGKLARSELHGRFAAAELRPLV